MREQEWWQKVESVFDSAVELAPEEQSDLLDRECRDDAELRAEVESLLTADREAGTLLDRNVGAFRSLLAEVAESSDVEFADEG